MAYFVVPGPCRVGWAGMYPLTEALGSFTSSFLTSWPSILSQGHLLSTH